MPNTEMKPIVNNDIKAPLKTDNKFTATPQKPVEEKAKVKSIGKKPISKKQQKFSHKKIKFYGYSKRNHMAVKANNTTIGLLTCL